MNVTNEPVRAGDQRPTSDRPSSVARLRQQVAFRNYTLLLVVVVTWLVFQVLTNGIFLTQRAT